MKKHIINRQALTLKVLVASIAAIAAFPAHAAFGDATISAATLATPTSPASAITIKTCGYDAGAICSLNWNGVEFINDYDHGRQLQSASSFDKRGEDFNPTEAGAQLQPQGQASRSTLLKMSSTANSLTTQTRMSFWKFFFNDPESKHVLDKKVTIGLPGLPNVIEYLNTFTIPSGESHTEGQFEVLTGYMPLHVFKKFYTFSTDGVLAPLENTQVGSREQRLPIIFANNTGSHAMGIYSPDSPQNASVYSRGGGYGRGYFVLDKTDETKAVNSVKWNTVSRFNNPVGSYSFRSYVIVGSLADVQASMKTLYSTVKPYRTAGAFNGPASNYTVSKVSATEFSVTDINNVDGITTIDSLKTPVIKFSDRATALDINTSAGQVFRLYRAAFYKRQPDAGGIGYWAKIRDNGSTLEAIAGQLLSSPEYASTYGAENASNDQFVRNLYKYALNRLETRLPITDAEVSYWVGRLAAGSTRAAVMAAITESGESKGLKVSNPNGGISYVPHMPTYGASSPIFK
ncbi:DUF4214 domain-containing protein [Parachitinimonas caeni]|uniref:DUF4214 domain-containing protein n=1 Tax=Parachitinimonas caeni TaxID=3031301 RepID=A0ABT7DZE5_9NEIS|nr:DUF4214 domain-containing protein [Parachitinimonas caeni]MDK2125437.1 DUF4214 domain-containing protein [Parachitinimonas caeni]